MRKWFVALLLIFLTAAMGWLYLSDGSLLTRQDLLSKRSSQAVTELTQMYFTSRRKYFRYVDTLSDSKINASLRNIPIRGMDLLTPEARRAFLQCAPEAWEETAAPDVPAFTRSCSKMGFRRAGRSVALASFPGSGSTWSRTLLEQATGVYTGAIYCDRSLKRQGFLGEHVATGNVIVIKTHEGMTSRGVAGDQVRGRFKADVEAAIYLARNVRDAVKSEINRKGTGRNHTGVADIDFVGDSEKWKQFVQRKADKYRRTVQLWLGDDSLPVIVIRYEDMIKDPRKELERMLTFLNYPVRKETIDCVISNQVQAFHRKHRNDFQPFSGDQLELFHNVMKSVEPLFNKYNTSYSDELYNF